MEDSRKSKRDGEKGLSTPNPHVDGGKGKKVIVYNTKEEKKEKKQKEKNKRNIRERKRENKESGVLSSHSTRACPRILFIQIYAYNSFLLTI